MDIRTVLASALLAATGALPASGDDVVRWDVPGVSSHAWESHPAIDPRTHDLWFVRSDSHFSGWQLMWSRCLAGAWSAPAPAPVRSEEHTSELQSLMRTSYAVFCLKQKKQN